MATKWDGMRFDAWGGALLGDEPLPPPSLGGAPSPLGVAVQGLLAPLYTLSVGLQGLVASVDRHPPPPRHGGRLMGAHFTLPRPADPTRRGRRRADEDLLLLMKP